MEALLRFGWAIVAAAALLWPARPAGAALALLARETFQGAGTLDAAHPGNLGMVTGSFYKRPGGPRVSGDATANGYGWSADLQGALATHYTQSASLGANYQGMICGWYYFGAISTDGLAARRLTLLRCQFSNDTNIASITMDGNGLLYLATQGSEASAGITPPQGQWCYFALAWKYSDGYDNCDYAAYYMPLGGSMTQLATTVSAGGSQSTVYHIGGLGALNGNISRACRYGAASRYNLTALTDAATYPADLPLPPSIVRHDWYLNPATGNDANDGTTRTTAWASAAKLNAESANLGMFPGASYLTGDILHLDCSGAALSIGVTPHPKSKPRA